MTAGGLAVTPSDRIVVGGSFSVVYPGYGAVDFGKGLRTTPDTDAFLARFYP